MLHISRWQLFTLIKARECRPSSPAAAVHPLNALRGLRGSVEDQADEVA